MSNEKPATTLLDGSPVPDDRSHTKLRADGMQQDYIVLSADERAKGFVRPVRRSYVHVGPVPAPKGAVRDLTVDEKERYGDFGYVKFEPYPAGSHGSASGRFWTQPDLDRKACGQVTRMGQDLAETYSRDPAFYSGTFCATCRKHYPVGPGGEFVWQDDPTQRVGT
jgi:hypothetical protein